MEPQIQYARTSDGVSIAYYAIGNGPPLLNVEFPSSLLAAWKLQQQYYEIAAGAFTLISYDARGFGLSDRSVTDFSIDGMVCDIEAVLDRLGIKSVRILANGGWTTPVSVAFAARHPESVSNLVLFWGFSRVPASMHEGTRALLAHPSADWRFVSESMMRAAQGWDDPNVSSDLAAMLRESISLDGFTKFEAQAAQWDVTNDLANVTASTLIVNPKDHPSIGAEQAAALAVGLRDARVVLIEGTSSAKRGEELVAAALPFLLPDQAMATAALQSVSTPTGTAVILFTDIVSSTALTERMGDAAFRDASRALEVGLRTAIAEAGGAAIDRSLGDGVLATFPSAAQAIDGARQCLALSAASELGLHIGLHAGDVIREDNDVFGGAVNIAARICALSAPGEILVSDVVRGMARSSAGVEFADRGEHEMKGVGEPVRVYAVRSAE